MPLTASKIEELKRAAADVAPAKGSVTATEAPEPDADASVDKGQVSRGRKKRPRGRPRKNQTPVVNNGTGPEAILAAQDELREACAEVAAAAEKRDAIVARIGELCQG